jgi:hypothetical protein
LYISIGVCGATVYNNEINISILTNLGMDKAMTSYILLIIFIVVLASHVPFAFFPAKETFLVIIDETENQSISKGLDRRLSAISVGNEAGGDDGEMAYKKMKDSKYIPLTLLLVLMIFVFSVICSNLTILIDIISAVSGTVLVFMLPAFFFLFSTNKL